MKKATIILLLVIQFFLLIIFQNIYSVFKGFEEVDLEKIRDPHQLMADIKRIKNIFSMLFIVTSLLFIGTAVYLGTQFKKSKLRQDLVEGLPPLHDYLLELKDSETQLKSLLEQQQADVIEKEELNKSIINNIDSAVIFINQSGRIDIFNAGAQKLFSQGYANARNNLPANVLVKFPGIVEFVRANEGRKATKEIAQNGQVFYAGLNPIENIGQLLMVKDITEEKKREAIDRRNSNFIMLGEMAAFLTHEIRNSLGVIYGYARTIKSDQDKIQKVTKEIDFMSGMMENFLKFSRPVEVDKKEEVDLVRLLKEISRQNNLALESNRENFPYESDPALLQSVFTNLLINSREAGADKCTVTFKGGKNNEVEILIADNGKGISPVEREKIWYPFFTTREKGTGMGLAVIRKIITTLKGEITLVETGTPGAAFKITFYG